MSLRARARVAEDETRSIGPPGGWSEYLAYWASETDGGSTEHALKNAASWACIDVIADALARTPYDAVRKIGKARVPIEPAPKVLEDPSGMVGVDVFRYQLAFALVTDGNAFSEIVTTNANGPQQMESLSPSHVLERTVKDGIARVRIDGRGWEALWPHGMIWHVPGRVVAPGAPWGLSPIKYASKVLGTSLSVEEFSNRFFTDGGHPASVWVVDGEPGPDQLDMYADRMMAKMRPGSRRPIFVGSGVKREQTQLDPQNTQFIDLARFEIEQACRFWRVPPSMAYAAVSGQNVTYANVTQADLNFLKHSLDGYFVRVENAWSRLLPSRQIVKANRDAILRADPLARAQVQDIRLKNRTTTINAVRAQEDEAPFDDPIFDEPGIPAAPVNPPDPGAAP